MESAMPGSGSMPPPLPPMGRVPVMSAQEIEAGKAFAILSYALNFANIPFWVAPLIMRDNAFSLYHAKQCFTAFLVTVTLAVVSIPLMFVFCAGFVTMGAAVVLSIVWNILGIINAAKGECRPLPMLPHGGPRWMDGIRCVPAKG